MEQKRKNNGYVFTWRFKLKISEYIEYLQELKNKHGDADITVRTKSFHQNLDIDENYTTPDKPYFDKYQKRYVIHSNFVRDEI